MKYGSSVLESNYLLNDKVVYSLAEDKKGNIWVGTENGGLNYLNRLTGKYTKYPFDAHNINSSRSNNIKSIAVDEKN